MMTKYPKLNVQQLRRADLLEEGTKLIYRGYSITITEADARADLYTCVLTWENNDISEVIQVSSDFLLDKCELQISILEEQDNE